MTADGSFELELDPEEEAAGVQAAAEGVVLTHQVAFMGDKYKMAAKLGSLPMMKFARAMRALGPAADGSPAQVESNMDAMAAMYEMVRDCIDPSDWDRFENDAIEKRADQDDLNEVLQQVTETMTARPTTQPSGSSAGRQQISGRSKGSSSRRRARG